MFRRVCCRHGTRCSPDSLYCDIFQLQQISYPALLFDICCGGWYPCRTHLVRPLGSFDWAELYYLLELGSSHGNPDLGCKNDRYERLYTFCDFKIVFRLV